MTIFKQFGNGVSSYIKAIELVFGNNLWFYFLFPLLINALIYFFGITFLNLLLNKIPKLFNLFTNSESIPHWLYIAYKYFSFVISTIIKVFVFYIYATISKYITLIFMSPIMAVLSMKTEKILTGNTFNITRKQFFQNIIRGILIACRNLFLQLLLIIISMFFVWIPIIGWLSPILVLLISFYFYGFSMIDYVNERRKSQVNQSIRYIRKNKGLAIGNGFIFTLLFNIPFVGLMLATVLSPVAACIAVLNMETETQTIL